VPVGVQHDGSRNHRPCQAPPADLINTRDVREPDAAQRVLERPRGRHARHDG